MGCAASTLGDTGKPLKAVSSDSPSHSPSHKVVSHHDGGKGGSGHASHGARDDPSHDAKHAFIRSWVDATPLDPSRPASRACMSRVVSRAPSRARSTMSFQHYGHRESGHPQFEPRRLPLELSDIKYADLLHHTPLKDAYTLDAEEDDRGDLGIFRLIVDTKTGETYTCRTIDKMQLDGGPEELSMLQAEVEAMHTLAGYPGIMNLHAVYEDDDAFHLVLDHCPGGDLFDRVLEQGRMPEADSAAIMAQVLATVEYLHDEASLMHRDISLENIFLVSAPPILTKKERDSLTDEKKAGSIKADVVGVVTPVAAVPAPAVEQSGLAAEDTAAAEDAAAAEEAAAEAADDKEFAASVRAELAEGGSGAEERSTSGAKAEAANGKAADEEEEKAAAAPPPQEKAAAPAAPADKGGAASSSGRDVSAYKIKLGGFASCAFFRSGQQFNDIVGSSYYIAPEVLRRNHSCEADMWSVGVLLYMMLSGQPPFSGSNEMEIFTNVMSNAPDFTGACWAGVSADAIDFVQQMLNFEPEMRPRVQMLLNHRWIVKYVGVPTSHC